MEIEKTIPVILETVDEFNDLFPEQRIDKSTHAVVYGESGSLDSLGLVNFIVAIEEKLEEVFGVTLTLADEKAMSRKNSPFRTIESLAQYVTQLLMEHTDG